MLTLYHCTTESGARQILADGFRDRTAHYLTDREWTGVWVSDRPLYNTEGASGETVLQIEIAEAVVAAYELLSLPYWPEFILGEWTENANPHREWLVPADVLNKAGQVKLANLSAKV